MRCSCALAVALPCGMMGTMDNKWARLGQALKTARAELQMEQKDVAAQIGVQRGALYNVESGAATRITPTIRAYARAVGWTDDSVDRVLEGRPPVRVAQDAQHRARPLPPPKPTKSPEPAESSDLSIRVQQALREGPLIDSRVTEVTTSSGRVKATIVVRGEEGAPEEQLLAALRELKINVTIRDLS